jgi:hypothetical protein
MKERTMTFAGKSPKAGAVDMKLEVAVIPVSDVDRAKRFYENLGCLLRVTNRRSWPRQVMMR